MKDHPPPARFRAPSLVLGWALVLGLLALPFLAPPDGRERAELAQFVGRFHPLTVHLPIALLLLVPVLEFFGRGGRRAHLRASAGFVLGLATATAFASAVLGWLLGRSGGYQGALVIRHMWGGVALTAAALLCCTLRGRSVPLYAGSLAATLGLLAWTGHQGGQLTHGRGFLTEYMPAPLRAWLKVPPPKRRAAAPVDATTFYGARVGPILESHCVVCHDADKRKGGLQLDTFAGLLGGGKDGPVVTAGMPNASELFRRITLPADHKDFMPADGKPPLSADEVKVIELWIAAGASPTVPVAAIAGAPALPVPAPPLAPDYRPFLGKIEALASSLGVQLVPRSKVPTDGLALRTYSAPERFGDTALASLSPVAPLIVEAQLSRTKVTDSGLGSLGAFANLRILDLSHTSVTSAGVAALAPLAKLESVNLTGTAVDGSAFASPNFHAKPRRLYLFQTEAHP